MNLMPKTKLPYFIKKSIIEDLKLGLSPQKIADVYDVRISSVTAIQKKVKTGKLDLSILAAEQSFGSEDIIEKERAKMSAITRSPHPSLGKVNTKY